jgi:hypothetical protein
MEVMDAVNHKVVPEAEWVEAHKAWVRHHDRYDPQPAVTGSSCCSTKSHS